MRQNRVKTDMSSNNANGGDGWAPCLHVWAMVVRAEFEL
jgi:hypothetical protein